MPLRCADRSTGCLTGASARGPISRYAGPLAACASVALTGCGATALSVQLPPKPPVTPSVAASGAHSLSVRQQVVGAFTGYNAALRRASDSRSAAEVRRLMRPYIDSATIVNLIRFDRSLWSKNEDTYGHVVYHILTVQIDGDHAFVHDCDNTSGSGLQNATTGQPIPGSLGVRDLNIVTRLNLVHGHWLIGLQTIEDVPCKQ